MNIRSAVSCLALAGSLLVAMPGPSTAAVVTASDSYESQVITYTNYYRSTRSEVRLSPHACVDKFAEYQAYWMAMNRTLRHQSMTKIMSFCGLRMVGENIAYGYSTAQRVVGAWMNSSGHRANIMNAGYRVIGVGAYQDKYGRWWVSQVFGTFR